MTTPPPTSETTVQGAVLRTWERDRETYCQVQLSADRADTLVLRGALPPIRRGQLLRATIRPEGQQACIVQATRVIRDAEVHWVFYSLIKGHARQSALKIVQQLGDDTHEIITSRPACLTGVKGIPASGVKAMVTHARRNARLHVALQQLALLGLPPEHAHGLLRREGAGAPQTFQDNPYASIAYGVPLPILDHAARRMGLSPFDPRRAPALIVHILRRAALEYGHTCLPHADLHGELRDQHALEDEEASSAIALALQQQVIRAGAPPRCGKPPLYLPDAHRTETWLAEDVIRLLATPPVSVSVQAAPHLTDEQRAAVHLSARSSLCLITGGPGTGKTTTLRAVLDTLEGAGLNCVLAAPTGKAASRLQQGTGRPATTLHRLLGYDGAQFDAGQLPGDVFVVDEVSMCSNDLLGALLRCVPDGARVILVGDEDQLPPIDAGHPLRALAATIPLARLTQTHRQAQGSPILKLAAQLIAGEAPGGTGIPFHELSRTEDVAALVQAHVTPEGPPMVLTAGRAGPLGTLALNPALQAALNPHGPPCGRFRLGDPVMVTRNQHDLHLMNGMTGRVTGTHQGKLCCLIDGEEHQLGLDAQAHLSLAYAMTIHRSQGSEWPGVLVVLSLDHERLLNQQLAYTAVTRAKQTLIAGGHRHAWTHAALTPSPPRHSDLHALLMA